MKVHTLSTTRVTRVAAGETIERITALARRGRGPRCSGATSVKVCFTKRFREPNNVIKYDSKTNLSVWLDDYRLACRAGEADDDLFII
jgi:hypothetical protein